MLHFLRRSSEVAIPEIEFDLAPEPLVGVSVGQMRGAVENVLSSATERRESIRAEIERLTEEERQTSVVIASQEAALAFLHAPLKTSSEDPARPIDPSFEPWTGHA